MQPEFREYSANPFEFDMRRTCTTETVVRENPQQACTKWITDLDSEKRNMTETRSRQAKTKTPTHKNTNQKQNKTTG